MSTERARTLAKYLKSQGVISFPSRPADRPMDCLYKKFCNNDLSARSLEHVFNSAFGGRVKVPWLICRKCNSDFSQTIDTSFTYALNKIKNARGLITERNTAPPIVEATGGVAFETFAVPVDRNNQNAEID